MDHHAGSAVSLKVISIRGIDPNCKTVAQEASVDPEAVAGSVCARTATATAGAF
jgi:hypothetical protein